MSRLAVLQKRLNIRTGRDDCKPNARRCQYRLTLSKSSEQEAKKVQPQAPLTERPDGQRRASLLHSHAMRTRGPGGNRLVEVDDEAQIGSKA
jgi:hypothetical protein